MIFRTAGRAVVLAFCSGALWCTGAGVGHAAQAAPADVLDLPLERLMAVSVISASRKSQTLSDVSSAVFVIGQEDIRHSGATTIPDLLRMVPGVQVGSINGNTWAVSIRGFNGTFANKLLVMIDGRSVYTPLYGGVFWDVQDTLLEDIERIEVIRGSGSTMWGANAVNGVVNIITKKAADTQGGLLLGAAGSLERASAAARYGSYLGENTSYRFYLKHTERDDLYTTTRQANDSLTITRGGFRMDSAPSARLNLTLQGDAYGGSAGRAINVPSPAPPFAEVVNRQDDIFGANLLSRLDWVQSEDSKLSLQLYYDRTDRGSDVVHERRDTLDLDLQHTVRFLARHELTWGAGYRFLHDDTPGSGVFFLVPDRRSNSLVNLFAQDEITLIPDTLRLTLGSKLEHSDFSGWEVEPAAKLLWTPTRRYSVWASVSRSVRTPTRGEQDVRIAVAATPPAPPFNLPGQVVLTGSREAGSESLVAYELGVRGDLTDALSFDLSTFFNQYRRIIDLSPGDPVLAGGQVTFPLVFTNLHRYDSTGAELSLRWQPLDWCKLKGGYSYIRFFGEDLDASLATKGTPTHQATLRSMFALGTLVDLDLWARYVGANSYPLLSGTVRIPAYTTLDARLAWRPVPGVELALVGQNLLQRRHQEAVSDQTQARHEVQPSVYGKVTWSF